MISVLLLLAVLAALAIFLPSIEGGLIYFPFRELEAKPADFALVWEDLRLETEDGVALHGWWLRGRGERAVLYFHGNGGNISHRLERARLLVEQLGLDLFLVDYRGYGLSEGKPSEKGLTRDARTIYGAARQRGFGAERIVLFGESLGSAVAAQLALEKPCGAVVLETPFRSVPALARRHYPLVPSFLIRTRFDTESKIGKIAAPKLIIAAERDEIVPREHAERLFQLAAPPKRLYVIPGASHNDTYVVGGTEYLEVWRTFLASITSASRPAP